MHSKVKSTLYGLVVVTGFVFGTTLLGEPVQGEANASSRPQLVTPAIDAASLLENGAGAAAERRARENTNRRLHLTMPYFAVGRLLPHRGES